MFHGYPAAGQPGDAAAAAGDAGESDHLPGGRSCSTPLEFGAAATLTDPNRAELMARFKSA